MKVGGISGFWRVGRGKRCRRSGFRSAGRDDEHAGDADLFDEVGVVADHDDGPGVVAEILADDFLGFGVEVVGRLVEEDEICALHEDFTEGDASFFSGGEDGNGFMDVVVIEEKVCEHSAEFGIGEVVGAEVFENGAAGVEEFEFLGVVGEGGVLAKNN